jgi:thiol-disulfide isomerase/thioredoxin
MRRSRLLAGPVAALLLLLGACRGGENTTTSVEGDLTAGEVELITGRVEKGGSVSAIGFERLDGTFGAFADYGGKPLVVNFFASTCPPCIKEMPEFEAVHQAYGDEVTFLGINVMDTTAKSAELVERTGITYDVVRDPRGELLAAFGGRAMPTTSFVDANGNLVLTQSKVFDADELRETIEEELR